MRLEARKYLYDIQEAAGLALQFTAGKSFARFNLPILVREVAALMDEGEPSS
jgi:hypothetical protein